MKNSILLYAIFCILNIELNAQSCLAGGAYLNTQEQVNNFSADNPGCQVIEGNVYIGTNIQNLQGLSAIREIQGDLFISQTSQLTSLAGLEQLEVIHGAVRIQNNSALISLEALSELTAIKGDYFYISDNPLLQNLEGLNSLDTVAGIFHINDLAGLKHLTGLESVSYIGDRLNIFRCDSLLSLNGLQGLREVGALDITDNPVLTSVQSLDHPLQINASLVVTDNPELSECNIEAFCEYLIDPPSFVVFRDNGNECSSREQVEFECTSNKTEDLYAAAIKVFPNPAQEYLTLDVPQNSRIDWIRLHNLQGKPVLADIIQNRIEISALSSGMYFGQIMFDEKIYHFSFFKN